MFLKIILSLTLMFLFFVLHVEVPGEIAFNQKWQYYNANNQYIQEYKLARKNHPHAGNTKEHGRIIKGKSITERNKIYEKWGKELREISIEYKNKAAILDIQSEQVFNNTRLFYNKVFSLVIVVILILIGYFIPFYKKIDILYLALPTALLVSARQTPASAPPITSLTWLIALVVCYLVAVHLKEKR